VEKESPLLLIEFLIKHANEPRHIQSIDRSRKNRDPAQRPVRLCAQTNFPLVSDALDSYLDLAPIKMIKVTAAILQRKDRVLIAKRSSNSSLPNKWEFPGGKVEPGETREGCLKRELWEEFKINVTVGIRMLTPEGHTVVEAAHVVPWSQSHDDHPTNGMCLCRLCHWSFDEGLMSVGRAYEVLVSNRVRMDDNIPAHILPLADRKIFTPEETRFWPSQDNLQKHYRTIYTQ